MFCKNCGKQIKETSNFCPYCGNKHINTNFSEYATNIYPSQPPQTHSYFMQYPHYNTFYFQNIINTLSQRIKINSIIWIVIASIQILLGLSGNISPLIIGILNLIYAVRDIKASKRILTNPTGIVKNAKPLVGSIINLLYNLFAGAFVGVIGSIYYLVAIRGFVLENELIFLEIEKSLNKNEHIYMPPRQR